MEGIYHENKSKQKEIIRLEKQLLESFCKKKIVNQSTNGATEEELNERLFKISKSLQKFNIWDHKIKFPK